MFSLSGCGEQRSDSDYRTGTEGLVLQFLPNAPPAIAYVGDNIDVAIYLSNKGAYDIRGGKLYLVGFDRNIINIHQDFFNFENIGGKTQWNLEGEKEIIDSITNVNLRLPSGVEKHNTQLEAIACYEYQTTASFPICIDPNPKINTHDACTVGSVSGLSQGGPIAVKSVSMEPAEGKLRILINIRNEGDGEVIDYNSCPYGYKYNEMNNIRSYDIDISGISLHCDPSPNELKLGEKKDANIYCTSSNLNSELPAYLTPITIKVNYDYKTSTTTQMEIRKEI